MIYALSIANMFYLIANMFYQGRERGTPPRRLADFKGSAECHDLSVAMTAMSEAKKGQCRGGGERSFQVFYFLVYVLVACVPKLWPGVAQLIVNRCRSKEKITMWTRPLVALPSPCCRYVFNGVCTIC